MATYSTSSNESSSNTDVLVLVYNSVTNTLNDEKRDKTTPFSFLNFLKYSGSNYKDLNELELYSEYLKTWEQKLIFLYVVVIPILEISLSLF